MTFSQSIRSVFAGTFKYSGRAARSEFWWFWLFTILLTVVVSLAETFLGLATWSANPDHPLYGVSEGPLSFVATLVLLLPTLAVAVRRLHDRNVSGWWAIVPYSSYAAWPFMGAFAMELQPVVTGGAPSSTLVTWFVLLGIWMVATLIFTIFIMFRGTQGSNRFGPDPLAPETQANIFA